MEVMALRMRQTFKKRHNPSIFSLQTDRNDNSINVCEKKSFSEKVNKRHNERTGMSHLSVQAGRHCDDSSCFIVDGKHVGGRTFGILRQDLVAQHPVRRFGVVFVDRRDCHNKCTYWRETQR